jgi:hypothetical protein
MQTSSPALRIGLAAAFAVLLVSGRPGAQQTPARVPQPGVPQIMTLEGEFIRIAYNNEGYVSLGYRVANESLGQEWMLLDVGMTVRGGQPAYKLTRAALSVDTPGGQKIPLATNQEYLNVDLRGIEMRAKTVPDDIGYFPPEASDKACHISLFAPTGSATRAFDDIDLQSSRGCLGRLYFRIPGGIKYGQHWLNVQFKNSLVRVPFRILTKDEEKELSKTWKDVKKQVEAAFKKGG